MNVKLYESNKCTERKVVEESLPVSFIVTHTNVVLLRIYVSRKRRLLQKPLLASNDGLLLSLLEDLLGGLMMMNEKKSVNKCVFLVNALCNVLYVFSFEIGRYFSTI